MKAWKHIGIFLVVALVACSCDVSKVKDISLTSVGIKYIVPTSARSMDAKLELGIDNPSIAFAVQEVSGTVRYNEKELAHFVTGPVELVGKSSQMYDLPCTITLAEGASLLDVLIVASKGNLKGLKADVDVQAALKKHGVVRAPFRFRDLDLHELSQQ
ncbi:MAG: hypothetical protein IJQ96_03975 [Bacteroidales bacterium]|jgi:hypothetical protein|nr:hypothetical protein [Bacteroidales bacterium]